MEKRYDVFISYSTQDQRVVEDICGFLEREGYRCFVAYRDIPRGVVWASAITNALDASKMMVVVFSNEFNMSKQTDREIEIASENNTPILTYRVSEAEMTGAKKYYLKNLNWIDAFPNPESCFERLLGNVVRLIGYSRVMVDKAMQEETSRLPKEVADRGNTSTFKNMKPLWIAFGAVAALVLLLVLLWPNKDKSPDPAEHEYVDLALPSGTLWATCNIGANKPEGYGNYYAWGETMPRATYERYNWGTYKYCNGDTNKLTKYCNISVYGDNGFTDNLTVLQSVDDPATANWGSGCQTPSQAQWNELLKNTTKQWTSKNGVKGMLFTAKGNGQSLFLPVAGYIWDRVLYGEGSYGYYWSGSLDSDCPRSAWYLYINSDSCGVSSRTRRGNGFSVRPVRQE